MPEEQAFGVLVRVMHYLGLRDMFRESFEQLQLRLYQVYEKEQIVIIIIFDSKIKIFFQLDRLIETQLPDLWQHFVEHGVESHMYASQWFLTLFTAKFPLFLVRVKNFVTIQSEMINGFFHRFSEFLTYSYCKALRRFFMLQ